MNPKATLWRWAIVVGLPALASCSAPGGPDSEPYVRLGQDGAADAPIVTIASGLCNPVRSAEGLPGKVVEIEEESERTTTVDRIIFTSDLYAKFKTHCGACHVDGSRGNLHVGPGTFATLDRAKVIASIKSDDPLKYMPPPVSLGKPYSERERVPGDPVIELLGLLEAWFAQDTPADAFHIQEEVVTTSKSYEVSPDLAPKLTNMGNCIPETAMVGVQVAAMDELDRKFEQATELPDRLDETDLVSLDAGVLAKNRVIAYAPAYPLWSDNSGKMRAIRVPRGKSVKFDKATQKFEIPANTRYYKTFLKKITDVDGNTVWRKIETRVIVSRPDKLQEGLPAEPQALFGTYAWNEDETEAILVKDPLRNGEPFRDRLFTYVLDEQRFKKVVDSKPPNLTFALEVENTGIIRHYAIPGKQRCIECHMGSPSADFTLGFTPLQVRRRPKGEAGTYEEVGADELNQLQRLIDYGVITGISSPSEIRGLEEPQGTRKYRNERELTAQAYLIGNCAHCHNPRGFPSVKSPQLVEALDFLPSEKGGIFQFPLDRVSPLRRRGIAQDIDIPYITPSLRDYPVAMDNTATWTKKWAECVVGLAFCDLFVTDLQFIAAPWRSILYRNVDTPYIYADDLAIFPHMPRHSAGFDCRAPRMLGDWMVSIPALHKEEGRQHEDNVRVNDEKTPFDTQTQPYVEVKPGEPDYAKAVSAAATRLRDYHIGKRYTYCPDQTDIVDRIALTTTDARKLVPPDENQFGDAARTVVRMPVESVPDHAHFVVSDLTEVPGDWAPRRSDWESIIVNVKPSTDLNTPDVPSILQKVHITEEMRRYATAEIPFGLWQQKPACAFPGVKRVKDYAGGTRAPWMDATPLTGSGAPPVTPDAPVYSITPGAAVFNNICVNCHGPQADSKGVLAEAISEMTGGDARVANFKDGLLGPGDDPGANVERVFGPIANKKVIGRTTATAEEWAGRYLAWMALGGTERILPPSLLAIVGTTRIMGQQRDAKKFVATGATPNMLQMAQQLCRQVVPLVNGEDPKFTSAFAAGKINWREFTGLIDTTGDAEMWLHLCSVGNRPVVRVPLIGWDEDQEKRRVLKPPVLDRTRSFFWGEDYPSTAPVMNHRGKVEKGIQPGNLMPICVRKQASQADQDLVDATLKSFSGELVPTCPEVLFEAGEGGRLKRALPTRAIEGRGIIPVGAEEWATRGAANAGIAVLLYLEGIRKGEFTPKPDYRQCEELAK